MQQNTERLGGEQPRVENKSLIRRRTLLMQLQKLGKERFHKMLNTKKLGFFSIEFKLKKIKPR